MVEALDTEIGRLLAALPDRANTHIVFVGDNGSAASVIQPPYVGTRGKGTLYEGGLRVPLVISGPAVAQPNRTNDTLVHVTDLYPTLLELAGGNPAAIVPGNVAVDGQSVLEAVRTTNVLARRVYAELFGSTLSTNVAGQVVRDERYKLIRFASGQERFHDLLVDPLEQTNLLPGTLTATQRAYRNRLTFWLYGYTTNRGPTIASGAWSNGMFSLSVTQAAAYTLWRCEDPAAGFWAPVPGAGALTNGGSVFLTDPAPPDPRALYKVVR
jgi:arylsulfatase A-like enzyme